MQAGSLVGAYDQLAAGNAFHLSQIDNHLLAGVNGLFSIVLKCLARGGEADLASGTVKELGADFVFKRANLGGNSRLRAKTLFRSSGEAEVPRNFEKGFYLIEIHRAVVSDRWGRLPKNSPRPI